MTVTTGDTTVLRCRDGFISQRSQRAPFSDALPLEKPLSIESNSRSAIREAASE